VDKNLLKLILGTSAVLGGKRLANLMYEKKWDVVAKQTGLSLTVDGMFQRPVLSGNYKGVDFKIHTGKTFINTIIYAKMPSYPDFSMFIHPRRNMADNLALFAGTAIDTGDYEFDVKFNIKSSSSDKVKLILTEDIKKELIEIEHLSLSIEDNLLKCKVGDNYFYLRAEAIFDVMIKIIDRINTVEEKSPGSSSLRGSTNPQEGWEIIKRKGYMNTSLPAIAFINPLKGWIGGSTLLGGVIFRTSDGGATWEKDRCKFSGTIHSIYFVDNMYGWAAGGGLKSVILHTCDGGATWAKQKCSLMATRFKSVYFTDRNNGWAAGGDITGMKIVNTRDGGHTWTEQKIDGRLMINSIYFTDSNNGWVGGAGQ